MAHLEHHVTMRSFYQLDMFQAQHSCKDLQNLKLYISNEYLQHWYIIGLGLLK